MLPASSPGLPHSRLHIDPLSIGYVAFDLQTDWLAMPATAFTFALGGVCELQVSSGELLSGKGFAVRPEQKVRFKTPHQGALIVVLDLAHPLHEKLKGVVDTPVLQLSEILCQQLSNLVPPQETDNLSANFYEAFLRTVVGYLLECGWASAVPRDALVQAALQDVLSPNPATVEELLLRFGVSRSRFSHRFHNATGSSHKRYVKWRKVMKAIMEAATSPSVTDTAIAGGFSDTAHYSRAISNLFGISPSYFYGEKNVVWV